MAPLVGGDAMDIERKTILDDEHFWAFGAISICSGAGASAPDFAFPQVARSYDRSRKFLP